MIDYKLKTLPEIKAEVDRLAARIDAVGHCELPTYGRSEDFARPHIEVNRDGYHWIVVERGEELQRLTTYDFDALLYRIFASVTRSLAWSHELAHRVESLDCRRIAFPHQLELIAKLSASWTETTAAEQQRSLGEHPFFDRDTSSG